MLNCNKIISLVIALSLVTGLLGCAGPVQSSKAESVVSGLSAPESSAASAVSKPSVQETGWFGDGPIINTAYTRASLSKNPVISTESYHSTVLNWVDLFIRGNYASSSSGTTYSDSNYTLETKSGKKEYFTTVFCHTEFSSNTIPEGLDIYKGRYQIGFQIVIETNEDKYGGPYTLVGYVTNQDQQIMDSSELYEFIKGAPEFQETEFIVPEPLNVIRLNTLGYDFTETTVDEESGLSVINMRALTGGLYVYDYRFYPDDLLVVIARDPEVENQKKLFVFEAEALRLLYQKTFVYSDTGYARFDYFGNSRVFTYASDENHIDYYDITRTGIEKYKQTETEEIESPTQSYYLSDTATIVDEKNCLYLEKNGVRKLLLEGIYSEDGGEDWENYNFYCRISDTRFIYEKYGYEWYDECGIYDIETREKTVFSHENAPVLNIQRYADGVAVLVADEWSSYDSFGPYIYDETTGELTDLNWIDSPDPDANYWFSFVGDILALYMETEPLSFFKMLDLPTKNETVSLYFAAPPQQVYYYASMFCKTEHYIWFDSVVYFPSDYLLRIPIER